MGFSYIVFLDKNIYFLKYYAEDIAENQKLALVLKAIGNKGEISFTVCLINIKARVARCDLL